LVEIVKSKKRREKKIDKIKSRVFLFLILVCAIFIRIYFFVGLNWSDDPYYVFLATKIFDNGFVPTDNTGLRIGLHYPVGFFFKIFGVNQISAIMYPLICSILSIILVYQIGSTFFNERLGILSALLLSVFPLDIIYSTQTMGEIPLSFLTSMSVFLFLKGNSTKNGNLFYLLSGVFIGFGYLTRITGLIPILFMIGYVIYKRKIKINYFYVLLGLSIILLLEGIRYQVALGDFFFRIHEVSGHYGSESAVRLRGLNVAMDYYPKVMFNLDYRYRFRNDKYLVWYGLFYYFALVSILYLLWKRKKNSNILLIWFLAFFLYLQFGSMSFTRYVPIHRLARHLSILTIPCVLVVAVFLERNDFIKKMKVNYLLVIFIVLTSLYYTYFQVQYYRESTRDVRDMYDFLKDRLDKKVFTDTGVAGHLRFYFKFEKNDMIRPLSKSATREDISDSYIVVKGTRGIIERPDLESKFLYHPEEDWVLIKTFENANLGIYERYDPRLYYVPE